MLELDADVADMVAMLPIGTVSAETLAAVRVADLGTPVELSDHVERSDHVVRAQPDVVVRVHRPVRADLPLPCVYSMHGGGYVLGSYAMDDARFDAWRPTYRFVGISVDYRLAPEPPSRDPLRTATPGCAGCTRTTPNSVSIPTASGSPGSAREVDWPRRWHCSHGIGVKSQCASSFSSARCSTTAR